MCIHKENSQNEKYKGASIASSNTFGPGIHHPMCGLCAQHDFSHYVTHEITCFTVIYIGDLWAHSHFSLSLSSVAVFELSLQDPPPSPHSTPSPLPGLPLLEGDTLFTKLDVDTSPLPASFPTLYLRSDTLSARPPRTVAPGGPPRPFVSRGLPANQ